MNLSACLRVGLALIASCWASAAVAAPNEIFCRAWSHGYPLYITKIFVTSPDVASETNELSKLRGTSDRTDLMPDSISGKMLNEWISQVQKLNRNVQGHGCVSSDKSPTLGLTAFEYQHSWAQRFGIEVVNVDWNPAEFATNLRSPPQSSDRKTKTVFFRDPSNSAGEKGFATVTFDIEYQLIACMGELHLAYSLVEDSVRQKKPAYLLDGRYWEPKAPLPRLASLPIKGSVYIPPYDGNPIGRFGDDFAAKSLGFGCFTGQTKEIAKLKDHVGDKPTQEQVKAFLDKLAVSFETSQLLTSAAAEEEIRTGAAEAGAAPPVRSAGGEPPVPVKSDEELAREQVARALKENEANFLKLKAAADAEAARQKAAQEAYERDVREAAAAKLKFEQERAAYAAEVERLKALEADYRRQQEAYRRAYKEATGKDAPQP